MAVAFPVMRALLLLGVVVIGCGSTVDATTWGDGAGREPFSSSGASGMAAGSQAGAQTVGGGGRSAVGGGAVGAAAGAAGAVSLAGGGLGGAGITAGAGGTSQAGATGVIAAGAGGAPPGGEAGGGGAAGGGEPPADLGGAGGVGGAGDEGPTEPACVCASGPCCDGCHYLPKSHFCGEVIRSSECLTGSRISHDYWNLFCSGTEAAQCSRWGAHTKYAGAECGAGLVCSGPDGTASCTPE